jgi:hypothetical protein
MEKIKKLKLSQGGYAIVDAEDYDKLRKYNWYLLVSYDQWYERFSTPCIAAYDSNLRTTLLLHRAVLDLKPGDKVFVDHRSGNSFDNRKVNLRFCSAAQNQQNRRKSKKTANKYKGVYSVGKRRWRSCIKVGEKQLHLGVFNHEEEAARAYDEAAREHFADFARCNFPRVGEESAL